MIYSFHFSKSKKIVKSSGYRFVLDSCHVNLTEFSGRFQKRISMKWDTLWMMWIFCPVCHKVIQAVQAQPHETLFPIFVQRLLLCVYRIWRENSKWIIVDIFLVWVQIVKKFKTSLLLPVIYRDFRNWIDFILWKSIILAILYLVQEILWDVNMKSFNLTVTL